MRQIAEAAWECADPGMQFDTTDQPLAHSRRTLAESTAANPMFSEYLHLDNSVVQPGPASTC